VVCGDNAGRPLSPAARVAKQVLTCIGGESIGTHRQKDPHKHTRTRRFRTGGESRRTSGVPGKAAQCSYLPPNHAVNSVHQPARRGRPMPLPSATSGADRPPERPPNAAKSVQHPARRGRPMPLTSVKSGPDRPPKRPPNAANLVQHPAGKGRPMPLIPSNIRPGEAAQYRYLQPNPGPTGRSKGRPRPLTPSNIRPGEAAERR
jgi:hypothetical protein